MKIVQQIGNDQSELLSTCGSVMPPALTHCQCCSRAVHKTGISRANSFW